MQEITLSKEHLTVIIQCVTDCKRHYLLLVSRQPDTMGKIARHWRQQVIKCNDVLKELLAQSEETPDK